MERVEMIEKLMEKTNVTREEAEKALEKVNWDLLDAIIYVERSKKEAEESSYVHESTEVITLEKGHYKEEKTNKNESCGGIGTIIGRIFKFIGKAIKKGNENFFEISKESEKPIRISLTISVLLLLIAFAPVVVLLIVGLFVGYKYSVTGPNIKSSTANEIFEQASKSANDIKGDFKETCK